ncbi:MAG TPA: peptidylprolyl isomerase [Candidatus Nanoarchaeia archaeon]|nr:peptidylprolyl isomerase [Candidatus Nanoarchaeia archaeon]
MAFKKGDFVEIDFVGKVSSNEQVFDSTIEKKAPAVVCLESGMLFPLVDKTIEGKNVGDEFELELKADDAFGQRNPKLVQLTNINVFRNQGLNPVPGLQVNIDGMIATIRSVSGGRVTIDFNHPLAGKNLKVWVKIRKLVTDAKEKLIALLKDWNPSIEIKEKTIEIKMDRELQGPVADIKIKQLKDLIPEIKDKEIKFLAAKG